MVSGVGRRGFLTVGGTTLLAAIAGCVGDSKTKESRVDAPRKPSTPSVAQRKRDAEQTFRNHLISKGMDVVDFKSKKHPSDSTRFVYALRYRSKAVNQDEMSTEMGYIAGAYAALVKHSPSPGEGLVTGILDRNGSLVGTFEIRLEWAEKFNSGEWSSSLYSAMILQTLKFN